MKTGLWHWQDDVELTAFEGYDGKPVFLRWQHNGQYVRKEEFSRGDHVLFDAAGWVLELKRPRQLKLDTTLALPGKGASQDSIKRMLRHAQTSATAKFGIGGRAKTQRRPKPITMPKLKCLEP